MTTKLLDQAFFKLFGLRLYHLSIVYVANVFFDELASINGLLGLLPLLFQLLTQHLDGVFGLLVSLLVVVVSPGHSDVWYVGVNLPRLIKRLKLPAVVRLLGAVISYVGVVLGL